MSLIVTTVHIPPYSIGVFKRLSMAGIESFGANLGANFVLEKTIPRDGAIIFGDLVGMLNVLNVACDKCGRSGRYPLQGLIEERGQDAKVIDWLDQLTEHCPATGQTIQSNLQKSLGSR